MFGTKVKSKPAGVLEQAITSTKEKRKRGTLDTEVVDLTDDVPEMKKAKATIASSLPEPPRIKVPSAKSNVKKHEVVSKKSDMAQQLSKTASRIQSSTPPPAEVVAAASLPTPTQTPQKKTFQKILDTADRYVPMTVDGIEIKNPMEFCLKPAYWNRWAPKLYSEFAEHLRRSFAPATFAERNGLTVEEVQAVFSAVVCSPLYAAAEATKRGEEGMMEIFEAYNRYGTPVRGWGEKREIVAELTAVENGNVVLTTRKAQQDSQAIGVAVSG